MVLSFYKKDATVKKKSHWSSSMSYNKPTNLSNQLLVSTHQIEEPFQKSVIYILDHCHATGATGLIINKPFQELNYLQLREHLDNSDNKISIPPRLKDHAVLLGGPIEPNKGHVLYHKPKSTDIIASASQSSLAHLLEGNHDYEFLVALGCCQWQPGQLENEIAHNDWQVTEPSPSIIFCETIAARWNLAQKKIKRGYLLTDVLGHA